MSEEEKLQLEQECLLKYSKAQMIQKYIDELEENCTLSDLWCKSQEENKQLKEQLQQKESIIKEVREKIEEANEWVLGVGLKAVLLEILEKENKND